MFIKFFCACVCSVETFNVNFIILIMNEGTRLATKHLHGNYLAWMDAL